MKPTLKDLFSLSMAILAVITFFFIGMVIGEFSNHSKLDPKFENIPQVNLTVVNTPIPTPRFSQSVLWNLIQKFRSDNHYKAYVEDKPLCEFAESRSEQIVTDFSHDKFYIQSKDLPYRFLSENLAKDYVNESETLAGWLYSASHSAVLKINYTYSCLRCIGNICAQEFANK